MKLLWALLLLLHPAYAQPDLSKPFLARITHYEQDGDTWSARGKTSTGHPLKKGVCATDPKIIPYGTKIKVPGAGVYVSRDTGSAVKTRKAAKGMAKTFAEYRAPVIDIYIEDPKDPITKLPDYVVVTVEK